MWVYLGNDAKSRKSIKSLKKCYTVTDHLIASLTSLAVDLLVLVVPLVNSTVANRAWCLFGYCRTYPERPAGRCDICWVVVHIPPAKHLFSKS